MSALPWLRAWADLLDTRFRVPGTNVRFGIDPLLALIPGLGDLASPVFAIALISQGIYQGVPRVIMLRMMLNALVDAVIGAVPVAGVVGDIFWRANTRNLALLERHSGPGVKPRRADYIFVTAIAVVFGVALFVPVMLAIWLTWLLLFG